MPHTDEHLERSGFERDTLTALQNLRSALGQLLAAVPGRAATPTDLQRCLGIDMKLCWKIHKVVRAATPISAGIHVPGMPSIRALLKAAGSRGVADDLLETTARAAEEFERVISTHAGDRATFESMVSALGSNEEAERVDLLYRRAGFRSARHAWGVSAHTRLVCRLVQPSTDPACLDIVTVQGYLDVRKLRGDARLVISHARLTQDDGTIVSVSREPLAPDAEAEHGIALMPQFCSRPLPTIRTVAAPDGFIAGELCGDGVGDTAAMTCVVGWVARGVPARWYVPKDNEAVRSYALVRTPTEVLINDVFVREGTFAPSAPTAAAYAECGEYADYPEIEQRGLAARLRASVDRIGRGPSAVHTPDAPEYIDLVRHVFDRLGWDGERFDVYRCRIEYPLMPSLAFTSFDLLPKPNN